MPPPSPTLEDLHLSLADSTDEDAESNPESPRSEEIQLSPQIAVALNDLRTRIQKGKATAKEIKKFTEQLQLWKAMPAEWREKYPSFEEMEGSEEMKGVRIQEATKRYIHLTQWLILLDMERKMNKPKGWIDEIFEFPGSNRIKVKSGKLNVSNTLIRKLPAGLEMEELNVSDCKNITALPSGMIKLRKLYASNTAITSIPDDLENLVELYVWHCKNLTALPNGMKKLKRLSAAETGLTSLPDDMENLEELDVSQCENLTALPSGMKMLEKLIAYQTAITSIPDDLENLEVLDIRSCEQLMPPIPASLSISERIMVNVLVPEATRKELKRLFPRKVKYE